MRWNQEVVLERSVVEMGLRLRDAGRVRLARETERQTGRTDGDYAGPGQGCEVYELEL